MYVQIICGIAPSSGPINGDNTTVLTLETTLNTYNIDDPKEILEFETKIRVKSEQLMRAICRCQDKLTVEERGELHANTDLICKLVALN